MPPNGKFSFTLDSSLRDVLHKLLLAGLSFLKLRGGRCPICNSLDPKGHKRTQTDSDGTLSLWLNSEFAELLKGEKHECNFCALVHEILDRLSPAFLPPGTTYKHLLITFKLEAGLTVVEFEEPTSRTKFCFQIYNATGTSIPFWPALPMRNHPSTHPGSHQCLQFVEKMIEDCVQNHDLCNQLSNSSSEPLPKRVLRISPDNKFDISLYENESERARYATLSHCWGSSGFLKTTMANLSKMKCTVTWDDLPQTFRNAISIAYQLGIRYLWIDALCIIQDSKVDWELESAKMGDYCRQAFVTIAASSSINGETPFLKARDLPTEFLARDHLGNGFPVHIRRYRGYSTNEQFTPLADRAWTWQEHLLSTRVIHFAEGEIIWECKSDICSEVGPLAQWYKKSIEMLSRQLRNDPIKQWHELIEGYSARRLTFSRDKLPAVSGAAAEIHKITGSHYLAGLWRESLREDLFWETVPTSYPRRQLGIHPPEYISPSWSWASAQKPVRFKVFFRDFRFAFEILDAQCTVPGLNPFGEVTSGYITLRGCTFTAELTCKYPLSAGGYELDSKGLLSHVVFRPDCVLEECKGWKASELSVRRSTGSGPHKEFCLPVTCLYLGHDFHSCCMILGRSESSPGTYTRLGYITVLSRGRMLRLAASKEIMTII